MTLFSPSVAALVSLWWAKLAMGRNRLDRVRMKSIITRCLLALALTIHFCKACSNSSASVADSKRTWKRSTAAVVAQGHHLAQQRAVSKGSLQLGSLCSRGRGLEKVRLYIDKSLDLGLLAAQLTPQGIKGFVGCLDQVKAVDDVDSLGEEAPADSMVGQRSAAAATCRS